VTRLISLEMEGFRIHRKRVIEFDPTVTVLVGRNSSGKSTCINAIRWVVFNRPLGDSVIRWGSDFARVRLTTETARVTREKGDGTNCYRISGNAKPYDAIGTSVPADVTKRLQLSNVNFQRQVEAPFWLSQSAAEVSREMNRVVDLDVIDRSMSYAASRLKAASAEIKVLTGLVEDARKRVEALTWVPDAEARLQKAERIAQACAGATRRHEELSRLLMQIKEAQRTRQKIPDTSKIDAKIVELKKVVARHEQLSDLLFSIKAEWEGLERCRTLIRAREEELAANTPRLCPACQQPIDPSS
jgi:exonuclease SbcC